MLGYTACLENKPMTQRRVKRHTRAQSLVWLLLFAVAVMGLTVTRQQALGSLHLHAYQGSLGSSFLASAVSQLASDWHSRWRQQQRFGHSQLRLHPAWDPTLGSGNDTIPHDHDAFERHHHAEGDSSVIAVDGAAESAESSATGALIVLPVVSKLSDGLTLPTMAGRTGPWPVDPDTAFASRNVAPPLHPPTA